MLRQASLAPMVRDRLYEQVAQAGGPSWPTSAMGR